MKQILRFCLLIAALVLAAGPAWADRNLYDRVKIVYVDANGDPLSDQPGYSFEFNEFLEDFLSIDFHIPHDENLRCLDGDVTAEASTSTANADARRRASSVTLPKGDPLDVVFKETNQFKVKIPADETLNVTVFVKFSEKIPVTITADDKTIPFGSEKPVFTATYSTTDEGFDFSAFEGDLEFECDYDPDVETDQTEYAINLSGLTSKDYFFTYVSGTLTVFKPTMKVRIVDWYTKEPVEGATFQIVDGSGDPVLDANNNQIIWISALDDENTPDVDESIFETPTLETQQRYSIAMVDAPPTYMISPPDDFTFNPDGSISTTLSLSDDGVYNMSLSPTFVEFALLYAGLELDFSPTTVQLIGFENGEEELLQDLSTEDDIYYFEYLERNREYLLRLPDPPYGFIVSSDLRFSVDDEGYIIYNGEMTETGALIFDLDFPLVKFRAVDIDGDIALEGAQLQVTDPETGDLHSWISELDNSNSPNYDESIKSIFGLSPCQTYTVNEVIAPDGYVIPLDITFDIDRFGNITSNNAEVVDGVVLIKHQKTQVPVLVIESGTMNPLAGAIMQVIDQNNNVVREWSTLADDPETVDIDESIKVIEGLSTGYEYKLRQIAATNGFLLSSDITFTIDESGKIASSGSMTDDGVLLVENSLNKVAVSVIDVATGIILPGATVQLFNDQGAVVESWQSQVDDPDTEDVDESLHFIEGLTPNVTYQLSQAIAPAGYLIADPINFEIDATGIINTTGTVTEDGVLLMENFMTTVRFAVVDDNDHLPLAGASFQLLNADGDFVESWESQTYDPEPQDFGASIHETMGLETGVEYTLHQTSAPAGYAVADDVTFSIDETGKVTSSCSITEDGVLLVTLSAARTTLFAEGSTNLWMTWCDENAYVKPEGVTVYTISSVTASAVTLQELTADLIPAYKPVILYRQEADGEAVTAAMSSKKPNPLTGYDPAVGICTQTGQDQSFLFYGATVALDKIPEANQTYYAAGHTYVLYGDKFLATDANNGIAANRCWLLLPAESAVGGGSARQLIITTDAGATGIVDGRTSTAAPQAGQWFGLDGRKLDGKPAQKCIYIYNGKKTVVK